MIREGRMMTWSWRSLRACNASTVTMKHKADLFAAWGLMSYWATKSFWDDTTWIPYLIVEKRTSRNLENTAIERLQGPHQSHFKNLISQTWAAVPYVASPDGSRSGRWNRNGGLAARTLSHLPWYPSWSGWQMMQMMLINELPSLRQPHGLSGTSSTPATLEHQRRKSYIKGPESNDSVKPKLWCISKYISEVWYWLWESYKLTQALWTSPSVELLYSRMERQRENHVSNLGSHPSILCSIRIFLTESDFCKMWNFRAVLLTITLSAAVNSQRYKPIPKAVDGAG